MHRVLDVACGIGTQAIGLAERGFQVTASDVSATSVQRAEEGARERGLAIDSANAKTIGTRGSTTISVTAAVNAFPPRSLRRRLTS